MLVIVIGVVVIGVGVSIGSTVYYGWSSCSNCVVVDSESIEFGLVYSVDYIYTVVCY